MAAKIEARIDTLHFVFKKPTSGNSNIFQILNAVAADELSGY